MEMSEWAEQARSRFRYDHRLEFFWNRTPQTFCVASPYWPRLIDLFSPYGRWRPKEKVWELPGDSLGTITHELVNVMRVTSVAIGILELRLSNEFLFPAEVTLDGIRLFAGIPKHMNTSEFSRETSMLFGLPSGRIRDSRFRCAAHPTVKSSSHIGVMFRDEIESTPRITFVANGEHIGTFQRLLYRSPQLLSYFSFGGETRNSIETLPENRGTTIWTASFGSDEPSAPSNPLPIERKRKIR